jgi:hypothetical protein
MGSSSTLQYRGSSSTVLQHVLAEWRIVLDTTEMSLHSGYPEVSSSNINTSNRGTRVRLRSGALGQAVVTRTQATGVAAALCSGMCLLNGTLCWTPQR